MRIFQENSLKGQCRKKTFQTETVDRSGGEDMLVWIFTMLRCPCNLLQKNIKIAPIKVKQNLCRATVHGVNFASDTDKPQQRLL